MSMPRLALGILGSGKGSTCAAILSAITRGELRADARLVVSDVEDARILEVAEKFGVRSIFLPAGKWRTKLEPDAEKKLVRLLREAGVEWIALAGFMRILKAPLLEAFPGRILNLHPSLLPKFPGKSAWAQALEAGERVTGCTVHLVDAGIDTGKIIAQQQVDILPNETAESLHARIQVAERELYPAVLQKIAAGWAA